MKVGLRHFDSRNSPTSLSSRRYVVSGGEHFHEGAVWGLLFGSVGGLVSFGEDFVSSVSKFDEGFAARPGVLAAFHCRGGEVRVAVDSCVSEHFLFDCHGSLEEFGVSVSEADPLGFSLEEAEVAAGARSPFVVVR